MNIHLYPIDKKREKVSQMRWYLDVKNKDHTNADGKMTDEQKRKFVKKFSCPAGHHFREGRWIRNPKYLEDYSVFWFRKGGSSRSYGP